MAEEAFAPTATPPTAEPRQVTLQKLFLKDCSLEVPQAPQVFTRPWQPQVEVNVGTNAKPLGNDQYTLVLTITVTAKLGEDVAFLVEVHQGGIFLLTGFGNDNERAAILGAHCPTTLFPFARQQVAELVMNAGFPQLLLQPVNFEQLYVQHLQRQRAAAEAEGGTSGIEAPPAQH